MRGIPEQADAFTPASRSAREIMFDVVIYLTIILSVCFPAVPWFFGARWGRKGVWLSTVFVVVALCCFPLLFGAACVASNCGQGAIAIFVLGPIWIASGVLTVTSAALAHYWNFTQRAAKPKRESIAE